MSQKIPFPAFTICEIGSSALHTQYWTALVWLEEHNLPIVTKRTDFGLCRIMNFCDRDSFFQDTVDKKGVLDPGVEPPTEGEFLNESQPYKTTSPELGVEAMISSKNQFVLMIHSPFELPSKDNQMFHLPDKGHYTFFVTPQLNTIDDTMIKIKPQE